MIILLGLLQFAVLKKYSIISTMTISLHDSRHDGGWGGSNAMVS